MSELKAFDITVAEEGYCEGIVKYRRSVYDKSEADKVIAHQKYKRCLAMAKWCNISARENDTRMCLPDKWKFTKHEEYLYFICYYHKWHRRWLELAEKFKEAK